jgi:hypothetical protein
VITGGLVPPRDDQRELAGSKVIPRIGQKEE